MIDVSHYDHPEVSAAFEAARVAIQNWTVNTGDEALKEQLTAGWSGVDLIEQIAVAILDARGFDTECLDEPGELLRKDCATAALPEHLTDEIEESTKG
jgi:hypothetical protein